MSSKVLKYLILLAIVLLIAAISSFWVSGPSFRDKDVAFELEGPTQVTAGDEVVYKIKYSNETRSTLSKLDLVFVYPEGSAVLSADGKITDGYSDDFTIDKLEPGEKGEKEFRAFLIGEKGSIKVAKATISFRSGTLSSVFEKNVSLSTTIINAPITLTLVAPPNVVSGAAIQYILDYRNITDEDTSDLILEFDYPDGFNFRQSDPKPDTGNNSWIIKSIKKGTGSRITISGILTGKEGESKVASVKLKRKISGDYIDYQKASAATVISNPVLGAEISVNSSMDYTASLGDRLQYVIKYSNNSNINFSGMNLSVKLEGDTFDFSTLDTRGGFYDDSSKTITWNPSIVSDFGNFTPGVKGQINFNIALKSSFPSLIPGASQDKFVKVSAKFGTMNVPSGFEGDEVAVSSALVTKVTTQPAFNQTVYYNDPNFGSTGPFPMKVGEETYFTVHWRLTNPGNDVENVQVVSKLPPGIEWANVTNTNNNLPSPTFNPNTNQVTWSLSKLPYGSGITSEKYEAMFRVKFKPLSSNKGNYIQLLESAQLTGMDNFTKESIMVNRNGVSSNELTDRPREGVVQ